MDNKRQLSQQQSEQLIGILKERFFKNANWHREIEWDRVQERLYMQQEKLWSLNEMELTQGEPDVIFYDKERDECVFCDCSQETPKGRRSICYDREAMDARKEHKPQNNALDMANSMGIEILTENQYRKLQSIGAFDTKTSSWVKTPEDIRSLGGAIFCDRRYNTVFTYHNSAESYYSVRGFRGLLRL